MYKWNADIKKKKEMMVWILFVWLEREGSTVDCDEDDTNPPGSTKYALLTVIRFTVYHLLCYVQHTLCILAKGHDTLFSRASRRTLGTCQLLIKRSAGDLAPGGRVAQA